MHARLNFDDNDVAQIHFGEALQFLSESVRQSTSHYSAYSSGLLRFEVGLLTFQVHHLLKACMPASLSSHRISQHLEGRRKAGKGIKEP